MSCHGESRAPGRSGPCGERGPDRSSELPSTLLLWMSLILALAVAPSVLPCSRAAAHPVLVQEHPVAFHPLVPQLRQVFGWWNLSCPACKGLFTALDFGLKVSAGLAGGRWLQRTGAGCWSPKVGDVGNHTRHCCPPFPVVIVALCRKESRNCSLGILLVGT